MLLDSIDSTLQTNFLSWNTQVREYNRRICQNIIHRHQEGNMTAIAPAASLRPRGIGELFDQAIRLYRANFLKFIGIIALVEIPVGLLQMLSFAIMLNGAVNLKTITTTDPGAVPSPDQIIPMLGGAGATILVSVLSFFLVGGVGTAALTRAIADGYMGEPVDILGSYRKIGKRWLTLLGALLLFFLISLVVLIWTVIPCVGWLTGPGLLTFLFFTIVPLLGPIIVLEKTRASTAIRRAWDLGRARFWWLIGYVGILYVFNLLIISGPITLLNTLVVSPLQRQAMMGADASQTMIISTVVQQGLSILLSILYTSLQSTAITLAYFDLRVRLEGFDLSVQTLSPDQNIVEQLSQSPVAQMTEKIINWNDVLHFFLLSLIFVAIYLVFMGIMVAISAGAAGLMH
jgi:hypothetical protein